MFYDMALLVDEQGDMVDRIEHNVENAAVHVEVGRKEIRTAVQFQQKNRKVRNIAVKHFTVASISVLVL